METIYSITSDKGDKVYIGRTGQRLAKRRSGHKYYEKTHNNCSSQELFQEYGFDNCVFTALEECAKEQGVERERYHIENTPNVVNILMPGRTDKEYDDSRKEQRKADYQVNKERKKAYMRELRAKKKASE
jgi:group I intron endonuclease